jgi:hypothetical protein
MTGSLSCRYEYVQCRCNDRPDKPRLQVQVEMRCSLQRTTILPVLITRDMRLALRQRRARLPYL